MDNHHILARLAHHAKQQPQKKALYLLNPNNIDVIDAELTYHELFSSIYHLAEHIKLHTSPGDRVLLCYPTGIDFIVAFYACLFAKVIAVTVHVPSNLGLIKKFMSIYLDCKPTLLLTEYKTHITYIQSTELSEQDYQIITTDKLLLNEPIDMDHIEIPTNSDQDLAFLQYTSGSTSDPKGVMISHGNLVDNVEQIATAFKSQPNEIGLNWLPHTHDMGLIGSFLHSVHVGAAIYLMSPSTFVRRPNMWLKALAKYQVNVSGGPCFALQRCIDFLDEKEVKQLDLSHLRCLIVGSEPIAHDVVQTFFKLLKPTGLLEEAFAPSYGLAESTLMVSTRLGMCIQRLDYQALSLNQVKLAAPNPQHATLLVSCGHPYQSVEIISLNTERKCREDEVGEVWLHGKSIAMGYWQKSEQTKACFEARINHDARPFFRTGDLGFLHQGELYIVGRLKDTIIIHGLNYYPQDLEESVLSVGEELQKASCVAFSWRVSGAATDTFIVLIRLNRSVSDEAKELLKIKVKKQLLKEYQLIPFDIQFVSVGLPKTTSGKLQRNACRTLYIENHTYPYAYREIHA